MNDPPTGADRPPLTGAQAQAPASETAATLAQVADGAGGTAPARVRELRAAGRRPAAGRPTAVVAASWVRARTRAPAP